MPSTGWMLHEGRKEIWVVIRSFGVGRDAMEQQEEMGWNLDGTGGALISWMLSLVLGEKPDMEILKSEKTHCSIFGFSGARGQMKVQWEPFLCSRLPYVPFSAKTLTWDLISIMRVPSQ